MWKILRSELSSGMPKRPVHLLILLLTLILGSPATAFAGLGHDMSGEQLWIRPGHPSHFIDNKLFEQVGLVQVGEPDKIEGTAVDPASVSYTIVGTSTLPLRRISRTFGGITSYEDIDALGRIVKSVNSLGGETLYTYNAKNQLATVKTPDAVTTTYTYNALGETISSVSTGSDPVTYARSFEQKDGKNCLKSVTSSGTTSSGIITSTTWNSTDGLKSWSSVTADSKTLSSSSMTEWTGASAKTTSTAADGTKTIAIADKGQLVSVQTLDSLGDQLSLTEYQYDLFGNINGTKFTGSNVGQVVDAGPKISLASLKYDSLDRVIETNNGGQVTSYEYDEMGRLITTTLQEVKDGSNVVKHVINYTYSQKGELLTVSGSQAYSQTYGYDLGRIKTLSTGAATTTWNYDPITGLLKEKIYPNNGKITYTYDVNSSKMGRLISCTNARNQIVSFAYNTSGALSSINYPDTTDVTLTYSTKGMLSKIADGRGTETLTRNSFGLITKMDLQGTDLDNLTHTYSYDDLMRRTSSAWGINQGTGKIFDATTNYSYDAASRLSSVSSEGLSFAYFYDRNNPDRVLGYKAFIGPVPILPETAPSAVSVSRNYDTMGRLTSLTRVSNDTRNPAAITEKTRTVDNIVHNGLNQRISVKRVDGSVWSYEYDNKGQLTKASLKASELAGAATLSSFDAAYDDIGNRLTSEFKKDTSSTETKTYTSNNLNQLTGLTVNGTASTLTYDADGNLTGDATWTYKFDSADRLIEMVKRDTTQKLKFFYDYAGRRYRKQVFPSSTSTTASIDTLFVYEGWNLVAELDNKTNGLSFIRSYTWGLDLSGSLQGAGGVGGLLAFKDKDGANYRNHLTLADERGNVDRVINPNTGLVENSYEYGSFGELLSSVEAAPLPLRFSTKYWDAETSLYYYGYRYYDAANGRWINRDPIGEEGGLNIYGMCFNDAINYYDYLGWDPQPQDNKGTGSGIGDRKSFIFPAHSMGMTTDEYNAITNISDDIIESRAVRRTLSTAKFVGEIVIPDPVSSAKECGENAETMVDSSQPWIIRTSATLKYGSYGILTVADSVPVVGGLRRKLARKGLEAVETGIEKAVKNADDVLPPTSHKPTPSTQPVDIPANNPGSNSGLLPSEGDVGIYKDLKDRGSKGDNITPHHIPSANHMEKHGVSKNDGVSINMEHPVPGCGGRHRETFTYGTTSDLNMTARDALAAGVRDARAIYMRHDLYSPDIRKALQDLIHQNKQMHPDIFKKPKKQ